MKFELMFIYPTRISYSIKEFNCHLINQCVILYNFISLSILDVSRLRSLVAIYLLQDCVLLLSKLGSAEALLSFSASWHKMQVLLQQHNPIILKVVPCSRMS